MTNRECTHECEQNRCPFVTDAHNPNRYVCLKCGLERSIDRNDLHWFLLLVITGFVLAIIFAR